MFTIEDEDHAESHGEYPTFDSALGELRRLARTSWDKPPNRAPCRGWQTCGRHWELLEWDRSQQPGRVLRRLVILDVSASDTRWSPGPDTLPTDAPATRHSKVRPDRDFHRRESDNRLESG